DVEPSWTALDQQSDQTDRTNNFSNTSGSTSKMVEAAPTNFQAEYSVQQIANVGRCHRAGFESAPVHDVGEEGGFFRLEGHDFLFQGVLGHQPVHHDLAGLANA